MEEMVCDAVAFEVAGVECLGAAVVAVQGRDAVKRVSYMLRRWVR